MWAHTDTAGVTADAVVSQTGDPWQTTRLRVVTHSGGHDVTARAAVTIDTLTAVRLVAGVTGATMVTGTGQAAIWHRGITEIVEWKIQRDNRDSGMEDNSVPRSWWSSGIMYTCILSPPIPADR